MTQPCSACSLRERYLSSPSSSSSCSSYCFSLFLSLFLSGFLALSLIFLFVLSSSSCYSSSSSALSPLPFTAPPFLQPGLGPVCVYKHTGRLSHPSRRSPVMSPRRGFAESCSVRKLHLDRSTVLCNRRVWSKPRRPASQPARRLQALLDNQVPPALCQSRMRHCY